MSDARKKPTELVPDVPAAPAAPAAPDLQELVARYGGYNKIPPEAWAQWDADTAAYQAWIRRKM